MSNKTYFQLVLHAHLPYILGLPVEYWLYEIVLDSYLPFLKTLKRLEQLNYNIILNISPILLIQLDSEKFHEGFEKYLCMREELLTLQSKNDTQNHILQEELLEFKLLIAQYRNLWNSNIITGFQYFQKTGHLTIITSAATHPYLPLLHDFPHLVNLQIQLGKEISQKYFGEIQGFWSPECGIYPELVNILHNQHLTYFFADASALNPYQKNYNIHSLFEYMNVQYSVRDWEATMKIWDPKIGFPGHNDYREFYSDFGKENTQARKILSQYPFPQAGFGIKAITDKSLWQKEFYNKQKALMQAHLDAQNYAQFCIQKAQKLSQYMDFPIISVFFDMELFGHWWNEGCEFLYYFCHEMAQYPDITMNKISSHYAYELRPNLSSWGKNNNAESWLNTKTTMIWQKIIQESFIIENELVRKNYDINKISSLLMAQASDWTFLITYHSFQEMSEQIIRAYLNNKNELAENFTLFLRNIL